MKSTITVDIPQNPYGIVIAPDSLDHLGAWLTDHQKPLVKPGQKLLVVSNPVIFRHYGDRLIQSLETVGYQVSTCILPAGERYKTLRSIQKIHDAAYAAKLERKSAMVALGGGVIGDMTGFAAATWLRGIGVVQVPTSLLAMVDASIGGKTGVNHPQGKNLIGAFHQPRLVVIDPKVLSTLPAREFRAGMAEVIKYGVIWDLELFEALEQASRLDQYRYVGENLLQTILTHSCQAKADVVAQDEKESGLRAILNYGHTIGHAVESATGYRIVNHGEAVAIGMTSAGKLATALNYWPQAAEERQTALIDKTKLPSEIPHNTEIETLLSLLKGDKKVEDGRVRFILPRAIADVFITDQMTDDDIRPVLAAMMGG
ncbi:3-dehydroquinate synthase [Oscillatoria sp. CS-180]|uniref:3-dehydroquinate synthase n=1 Tax=Oscillatoria sp. CS-180 TaxID=3021720 RepID=UPI002330B5A2|nr:3-dehydroquinate synthase [Oscillatoria sp. CS-180]MDB9529811.1 3-dehydroquinate synthase [Oscillatoria sp. CS-180]